MCVSYHTHTRIYVCRQPSLPQPAGQTNSWPRSTALSPSHTLMVTQSKCESIFEDSQTHSVYSILKCTRHIHALSPPPHHLILRVHVGPMLDQHPARGFRALGRRHVQGRLLVLRENTFYIREHILHKRTHSTRARASSGSVV